MWIVTRILFGWNLRHVNSQFFSSSVFVLGAKCKQVQNWQNDKVSLVCTAKSVLLRRLIPKHYQETFSDWKLGNDEISVAQKATHLGLIRTNTWEVQTNIEEIISCARRTFYSITSSGLHGTNGLSPLVCFHIYSLYVVPRLLYG